MTFHHFLITRFNLRLERWQQDKSGNEVLTDAWMEKRMDLFLRYCLPSVCHQQTKSFRWIIYLDTQTAVSYRTQFEELVRKYPFMIVRYVSSYEQFQTHYGADVVALASGTHVITSRLDNDDVLHREFVARVQSLFCGQDYMAVNFLKVLMLSPADYHKVHIDYQFSNHFVSLIEKISEGRIRGCYSKDDRSWDIAGKVIHVTDKPYCMELISGQNLVNSFRGFPVLRRIALEDFGLEGSARNRLADVSNLKVWRMSWRKYLRYLMLRRSYV